MFEKMNIFNGPSLRILRFLGRKYREDYHTRELVRKLGISLGTASKCLKTLEQEDLLIKKERGRLSIYQANMENPILRELKLLFTIIDLEDLINDIKNKSDRIILFGSCATGEDTSESDIDLFILTDKARSINKIIDIHQKEISRHISPVIVTNKEFRELRDEDRAFYSQIMKGRSLYEVSV